MKEFVVSADNCKAKLKIGEKEYKFRSPTAREVKSFSEKAKGFKGDDLAAIELMEEFLIMLGNISKDVLEKLPADQLLALSNYLATPFGSDDGPKKS